MEGDVYEVVKEIKGVHPIHDSYPLMERDILVEQQDGTFYKAAIGLGITGFVLTEEQLKEHCKKLDKVPPLEIVGMDEFLGGSSG